jgi:flagellar hook-associated protein 2
MASTTATGGVKYDPATTAAALAESFMSGRQDALTTQTKRNAATSSALTTLKAALKTYQASLAALSTQKSMISQAATFSATGYGTASATSTASAGTYSFFVDTIATGSQVSFGGLTDTPASGGTLVVNLGGGDSFNVDLGTADKDSDGTLTPKELAAAINAEPLNASRVSASILTVNGQTQMVLTSRVTGATSQITLASDGLDPIDPALDAMLAANVTDMVLGQDAVVYLGNKATGTMMTQASNTFNVIDQVTMTFTKAQDAADAPLTLTVGTDSSATTANVQGFVDAYNKLKSVLDGITSVGDPKKGVPAAVLANDGPLSVLRMRMLDILRTSVPGVTQTLAGYGITSGRDGLLTLNAGKLASGLALSPTGLDALIGTTGVSTSMAGKLDKVMSSWSHSITGQLTTRQAVATKMQMTLEKRQTQLDDQFNSAYKRYLAQFTQLQTLQSQMDSNVNMFDAMFSSNTK